MNKKSIRLILLAAALMACPAAYAQKVMHVHLSDGTNHHFPLSQIDSVTITEKAMHPIIVNVTENPLTGQGTAKRVGAKAPILTTNSLTGFSLFYWNEFFEQWGTEGTFIKEGRYWTSNLNWPEEYVANDTDTMLFYAYNSGAMPELSVGDEPFVDISTEEYAKDQIDLLAATQKACYSENKGTISLTFDHISAAVKVNLKKAAKLEEYTVKVAEVVLHNIVKKGYWYFDRKEWVLSNEKTKFTILAHYEGSPSVLEVGTDQVPLDDNDQYLFLLPQTLTKWSGTEELSDCYVEIKCKIYKGNDYKVGDGQSYGSAYLPLGCTLKKGEIHNLTISIGTTLRDGNGNKIFN